MNIQTKFGAIIVGTALVGSTILAGCGGSPAASGSSLNHPGKNNPEGLFTWTGGWPVPPQYQGNPFGSGGVGWPTNVFAFEGLFQFVRTTDKIYNHLAVSYDNSNPGETIVKMRKDAKWSDGQPITSKDIWAYYTLNNGTELTHYITGIETPDQYTVVFKWAQPAPFDEMKMLFIAEDQQGQIPYHYYKKWVDKAAELLAQAKPSTDPKDRGNTPFGLKITDALKKQLSDNWNDFSKHGPAYPISSGAFEVKKVTQTDLTMEKNPNFYDATKVKFKKIDLKMVPDLNQQYALLKAGKLDHYDGTQPKDILESILAANNNLVHYQINDAACVGFMFNQAHKPFDDKTFRQAIIYALDREKIREVANYYGVASDLSGTGMPGSQVPKWIDPALLAKFTKYSHDEQKASQLLNSIGWTKNQNGIWRDKDGKSYNFTIASASDWVPAVNAGEVVAEQLTTFGLPTKYKAVDSSIYWNNVNNAKGVYDMSFDWMDVSWGFMFPWNSMRNTYWSTSFKEAHMPANILGEANFVRQGYDGETVDVSKLLHQIPYMSSTADRKHAIDEIAYVTNEDAWEVNLFQNTTGTWYNTKTFGGLPWQNAFKKYNRSLPLPTDPAMAENIAEIGFAGTQWLVDGKYYPN